MDVNAASFKPWLIGELEPMCARPRHHRAAARSPVPAFALVCGGARREAPARELVRHNTAPWSGLFGAIGDGNTLKQPLYPYGGQPAASV